MTKLLPQTEAVSFSKITVATYQTARCYNLKNQKLHLHQHEPVICKQTNYELVGLLLRRRNCNY